VVMTLTHQPALLVLSRQAMPTLDRTKYAAASGVSKGAYVLADAAGGKPELILIGTGSELSLCVEAHEKLTQEGIRSRVVSMPSWELFEKQNEAYKESVFPTNVAARVSVEMGATLGWDRYVGPKGEMVGMHRFGASAPIKDLLKKFGFTTEAVIAAARKTLARAK
jgi:transketolase